MRNRKIHKIVSSISYRGFIIHGIGIFIAIIRDIFMHLSSRVFSREQWWGKARINVLVPLSNSWLANPSHAISSKSSSKRFFTYPANPSLLSLLDSIATPLSILWPIKRSPCIDLMKLYRHNIRPNGVPSLITTTNLTWAVQFRANSNPI